MPYEDYNFDYEPFSIFSKTIRKSNAVMIKTDAVKWR